MLLQKIHKLNKNRLNKNKFKECNIISDIIDHSGILITKRIIPDNLFEKPYEIVDETFDYSIEEFEVYKLE